MIILIWENYQKKKIIKKENIKIYDNDESLKKWLINKDIEVAFSVGFPNRISKEIFTIFSKGAFNIHPGKLPEYRGQHVINWAIINGAKQTALALHEISEKFDEGPILYQKLIHINKNETANTLNKKMIDSLSILVKKNINKIKINNYKKTKQLKKSSKYWSARKISDGEILLTMSCTDAERLVRGLVRPWPGAYIEYRQRKIFIYKVKKIKNSCFNKNQIFFDKKMYLKLSDGILMVADAEIDKKKLTATNFRSI